MNESKRPQLTISAFPYSDVLFKNEIPWYKGGGFYSTNEEIDMLIVGSMNDENVVYLQCDCVSIPRRVLYIQTKLDYRKQGFAALLLEYFLKNFAEGGDVEASSPTSSGAKKLLEHLGFVPSGHPLWWIRKKE